MSSEDPPEGVEVMEGEKPVESVRSRTSILAADEPILPSLIDHFTLPTASSTVRLRSKRNAARVYEAKGVQMVMEEHYDEEKKTSEITVRRLSDETSGVQFLRFLYSIVCALWTGFFFVFCVQVLLFLVLDLAVESGATQINATIHVGPVIGVVLAIIVFVHAFSEGLVIAGHYILDAWSGHFLTKQFIFKRFGVVTIEWIYFSFFLLFPLLVMCIALLLQRDDWWSITAIVWFSCILAFFVIFCFNIVFYEVKAGFDFCMNKHDTDSKHWLVVVKRCILMRQTQTYCGKIKSTYLASGYFADTEDTEDTKKSDIFEETRVEEFGWWANFTKWMPERLFRQLDDPVKLHTIEDVQDFRPFLTKNTWSLERIFCRPKNSRYIAIISGPGSLTQSQIRSSLVCSLIGTVLIVLLVVSFLVWFRIGGAFVAFVFFICLFFAWNALSQARNIFKVAKDLENIRLNKKKKEGKDVESEVEDFEAEEALQPDRQNYPTGESKRVWEKAGTSPSEAVYLVSEYNRLNEITELFCWVMFALEIGFLFIFPLFTLLFINWNIGVMFLIVAPISGIRWYVNAAVVIEETGNMDLVGGATEEERWENKSRLNEIVGSITVGKSRKVWVSILGAGGFGFMAIFLGAVGSSTESTSTETFTYLPNFYYPPMSDDMRYPTCTLSNMNGGFGANSTLADFAFLSSIAYSPEERTQPALDNWFGDTIAIDEQDYVDAFREREDPEKSAVFFKLFSFPEQSLAMIAIRGTSNNWDMVSCFFPSNGFMLILQIADSILVAC
jgi:hypothetical protein